MTDEVKVKDDQLERLQQAVEDAKTRSELALAERKLAAYERGRG